MPALDGPSTDKAASGPVLRQEHGPGRVVKLRRPQPRSREIERPVIMLASPPGFERAGPRTRSMLRQSKKKKQGRRLRHSIMRYMHVLDRKKSKMLVTRRMLERPFLHPRARWWAAVSSFSDGVGIDRPIGTGVVHKDAAGPHGAGLGLSLPSGGL